MKFTTVYEDKDKNIAHYTTKRLTDYHKFLRDNHDGRTYEHPDDAYLYFIEGMPLTSPIPYELEIK